MKINPEIVRLDFPILRREIRPGIPLVYLDSSATSQKPQSVIDSMNEFYRFSNANIHRGVHTLAEESTAQYEGAREKISKFINSANPRQIIFSRNTTESINLVVYSWGRSNFQNGDLVVLTEMEHHSNLVPWQILSKEKGIRLEFIPVDDQGLLDQDVFENLLKEDPKLVSFTHMSNVLGTINPAKLMIEKAHAVGAITLLDGAQSVPHFSVDVQDLDVDFLAFSSHKMVGPTGIGVLYGKTKLLENMPPFLGGGDMIKEVKLRSYKPNSLPHKFEAGTPAIAEAIGFGAAVDYLLQFDADSIVQHEHTITSYAIEKLSEIKGLKIFGPSAELKGGVVSFTMDSIHPHDVAQILDSVGVAVRAGHHCAQPLHERFNVTASTRASFYIYTTLQEVDTLIKGLHLVKKYFD